MTTNEQTIDSKTIQLLELLDKYQQLTTSNRENFINGFSNLSRANFQNDKSKYGLEKFDFRCYKACKIIDIKHDKFELINRLMKVNNNNNNNLATTDSTSSDEKESSKTIRNRKDKKKTTTTSEDIVEKTDHDEFRDPIKQFGTIVPYELYKCQENFNNVLNQLIQIINLQKQINQLIQELN